MTTHTTATAALIPTTPAETSPASSSLPLAGETVFGPSRLAGALSFWSGFRGSVADYRRGDAPPLPGRYDRIAEGERHILPPLTVTDMVIAIVCCPVFIVRAMFGFGGDAEVEAISGRFCEDCRDVHPDDSDCPRLASAQCDICGTVALDRYMCCPHGKSESHHIVKSSIRPRLAPPTPLNEEMVMSG